jgi:hypothetical protein
MPHSVCFVAGSALCRKRGESGHNFIIAAAVPTTCMTRTAPCLLAVLAVCIFGDPLLAGCRRSHFAALQPRTTATQSQPCPCIASGTPVLVSMGVALHFSCALLSRSRHRLPVYAASSCAGNMGPHPGTAACGFWKCNSTIMRRSAPLHSLWCHHGSMSLL